MAQTSNMINRKYDRPELHGSVFILQMVSTRNKRTNEFDLLLDGNFNQTLHLLKNATFDDCTITVPNNTSYESLVIAEQECKNIGNITLLKSNVYGQNAAEHRKLICDIGMYIVDNAYDVILSDFPVAFFQCVRNSTPAEIEPVKNVLYRYNWNKINDDDESEAAKYFENEVHFAKTHKTFVYSDVQYDYMSQFVNVYRMHRLYDLQYLKDTCNSFAAQFDNWYDIRALANNKRILFYPCRIEDPRYQFDVALQFAERNDLLVVVTNPTNVEIQHDNVVEIGKINKRIEYFHTLKTLTSDDFVFNVATDFHLGLLEQATLTNAQLISSFTQEQISTYIY